MVWHWFYWLPSVTVTILICPKIPHPSQCACWSVYIEKKYVFSTELASSGSRICEMQCMWYNYNLVLFARRFGAMFYGLKTETPGVLIQNPGSLPLAKVNDLTESLTWLSCYTVDQVCFLVDYLLRTFDFYKYWIYFNIGVILTHQIWVHLYSVPSTD